MFQFPDPGPLARQAREDAGGDVPHREEAETDEQYALLLLYWSAGDGSANERLRRVAAKLGGQEGLEPRPCWHDWRKPEKGDWDARIFRFEQEKAEFLSRAARRTEAAELARRRGTVLDAEWSNYRKGQKMVDDLLAMPAIDQEIVDGGKVIKIKGMGPQVRTAIESAARISQMGRLHVGLAGEITDARQSQGPPPDDEALAQLLDLASKV